MDRKEKIYKNAVLVKSKNKRLVVQKVNVEGGNQNTICFKSLTSETGADPGALHDLSSNQKVKYTKIGLSDQAILDLYAALEDYVKYVL